MVKATDMPKKKMKSMQQLSDGFVLEDRGGYE